MIFRTALRAPSRRFLPIGSRAMSSLNLSAPSLPLTPPTLEQETAAFQERVADMEAFFNNSRFASIKRPYTAEQVVSKQGSLPVLPLPSTLLANKLYALFENAAKEGRPVHTMGAIDPVQMTQMAPHQEVVYVSGWACSSVLTTGNNDVGPDLGCAKHSLTGPVLICIAFVQRLSLHYCTKPSASYIPRSAATRQETL